MHMCKLPLQVCNFHQSGTHSFYTLGICYHQSIDMCARETSTTPDSSRLQTLAFRHLGDCESSCCKSRHTCCSQASCIWMVYSYKASTARTYLKYLSCMRQSPIICTHAWPSCHFDLSTYNNLTLPHLGPFLGDLPMPLEVYTVLTER